MTTRCNIRGRGGAEAAEPLLRGGDAPGASLGGADTEGMEGRRSAGDGAPKGRRRHRSEPARRADAEAGGEARRTTNKRSRAERQRERGGASFSYDRSLVFFYT
jgi:hypothetical protein